MIPKTEEAIKLAEEIKNDIVERKISVTNILMKCKYLATLLNKIEDLKWINSELRGYSNEKEIPKYRIIRTDDATGRHEELYRLRMSCPSIETQKELFYKHKLYFESSIRKKAELFVFPGEFERVFQNIINIIFNFVIKILIELKFGKMESDIFEETRTLVNRELSKLCPQALQKLTETYEDLTSGKSDLKWSQVAFACREILMDFTDSIFKPEFLREGEETPTRTQTKNKLQYTLRAKVESETNRELVESQLDYFDKLTNFVQNMAHPAGFDVTKEDANRCVIYTYLLIGDVIKLLKV